METEMIILYGTIVAGVCLAAYKAYKRIMADGKVSLDEVIDLVGDIGDIAKTIPSRNQLNKMKKDDLIALCEKNNLDISGVRADLISRLDSLE